LPRKILHKQYTDIASYTNPATAGNTMKYHDVSATRTEPVIGMAWNSFRSNKLSSTVWWYIGTAVSVVIMKH